MRPHPRSCPRLRCSQLDTHVTTESGPRARPVKPLSGSVQVDAVPRHRWAASPLTWADVALRSPHQPRPRVRCSHPGPRAPAGSAKPQGQAGDGKPRRAQGRAEAAGPVPAAGRAHSPQASVRPGSARPPAPRPGACAGPPARPPARGGSKDVSAEPPRRPARPASLNCSPLGRRWWRLRQRRVPAPSHAEAASHRPGGAEGAGPGAQAAGPAPQVEREPHRGAAGAGRGLAAASAAAATTAAAPSAGRGGGPGPPGSGAGSVGGAGRPRLARAGGGSGSPCVRSPRRRLAGTPPPRGPAVSPGQGPGAADLASPSTQTAPAPAQTHGSPGPIGAWAPNCPPPPSWPLPGTRSLLSSPRPHCTLD